MGKHRLVEQPTSAPTLKVAAAGAGGGTAAVVVGIADLLGLEMPATVAAVLAAAVAALCGYLKKDAARG